MSTVKLFYLFPYVVSVCISGGVAWFAWRQRYRSSAAKPFAITTMAQAFASLFFTFETAANSVSTKIFWDAVQWFPFFVIPVTSLAFLLAYTGRRLLYGKRGWHVISIIIGAMSLVVLTEPLHKSVYHNPSLVVNLPITTLHYDFSATTWILSVIILGTAFVISALWIEWLLRVRGEYRVQTLIIIVGLFFPAIVSLFNVFGFELFGQRDSTPFTFAIGNIITAWGLFRYRLLDLVPVARDRIIETVTDGVIVLDRYDRIVDLNPAARALSRSTHNNVIGQTFASVFPDWEDLPQTTLWHSSQRREVVHTSGETVRHFELRLDELKDPADQTTGRVLLLREITELVRSRQELRRQLAEIELQNTSLEQARTQAEEANRVKSQFLSSMSHELRTPLNAVISLTQLVSLGYLGPVNEQQSENLNSALQSARHLLELINDVLDVSKIEAGMMSLFVEENIDIPTELSPVCVTIEALLIDKPVKLIKDLDAELPQVVGDRRRIRQIILNMLANAVKFTPEGSITLSIKNRGDHLLFAVIDTGPGIPSDKLEAIFRPFEQTEEGIRKGGGTGLGLAISRWLVEAHGGKMWVESDPGDGAAFFFTLPVRNPALVDMLPITP